MSAGNFFETERKAFKLREKEITTSASLTTYTARVGGASDNFIVDRVILVTTTAGNNLTITIPDGKYAGQQIMVSFVAEGNAETVDTSTTTGDDGTQLAAAGSWTILVWRDDTNGWDELATGT